MNPVADRIADVAAGTAVGTTIVTSVTIMDVNAYLQAGAYIVSMVVGIFAALYYWRGARSR